MKVKKKPKCFYFLGYLLEFIISDLEITFFGNLVNLGPFFSMKSPLYMPISYFSG
jgi:hypothetical protein